MADTVTIKISDTSEKFIKGGARKAYILDHKVMDFNAVIKDAAQESGYSESVVRNCFNAVMTTAIEGIEKDGRARTLGDYYQLDISIGGNFDAKGGNFDAEKHPINLLARPLKRVLNFDPKFKVVIENAGPKVVLEELTAVFGEPIVLTGENLAYSGGSDEHLFVAFRDPCNTACGRYQTTIEPWTTTEGATKFTIPWSELHLPAGYTPAGPCELTVEIDSRGGLADANLQRHTLTRKVIV